MVPCSYEILGCLDKKRDDIDEAVPGIARMNKETGVSLDNFLMNYSNDSINLNKHNCEL